MMIRVTGGGAMSGGSVSLVLLLGCCRGLAEAEHVRETELRDAVAIRNLTLSLAKLTTSVEFYQNINKGNTYHLLCYWWLIEGH
jgi:hypothetical protein